MDDPPQPRTLADFPYVTIRLRCPNCPERRGRMRLARAVDRFGSAALLEDVLYELTRSCRWQVRPETKRRPYVPYCRAYFLDLDRQPPPDEPPPNPPTPRPAAWPKLRVVGEDG